MTDLQYPLDGKVAMVTGGGTGIGLATALMLASRGARIAVAGREAGALDEAVRRITERGGEAIAVIMDVAVEETVEKGIAQVVECFGRLDILHSNAAQTGMLESDGLIGDMDADFWDRAFAVNLRGAMLTAKHTIPHMLVGGGGSIIFTGSGKGLAGDLDFPAYGTTKAGMLSLSRYIATQYGKRGIRSNVVVVGLVMTDALDRNMPPQAQALMREHNVVDYLGRPEDIAEVVAFLASDQSRYVTGTSIVADGGFTSHSAVFADMMRFAANQSEEKI